MLGLSVESNGGKVSAKWKQVASGDTMKKIVVTTMRKIGIRLQGTMMRKVSGDLLNVRSGRLRRSLYYLVVEDDKNTYVSAGANLLKAPYGRIHDLGGVINRTGPNGNWSIRIKPTGYVTSSLQDDRDFINEQVDKAAEAIVKELANAPE